MAYRRAVRRFDGRAAGNVHFNIWWSSVRLREHACESTKGQ